MTSEVETAATTMATVAAHQAVLERIAQTSPIVGEQSSALEHAIDAERAAETAVLEAALVAVRPALRGLASSICKSSYETAGRNGCNPVSRSERYPERGVRLVDRYKRVKDDSGNRGSCEGYRLYLLSDGRLAEVTRQGSFSHWQGEADEWESTLEIKSPAEVMADYDLGECLAALDEALRAQLAGDAPKCTAAALARAERLAALATLVQA